MKKLKRNKISPLFVAIILLLIFVQISFASMPWKEHTVQQGETLKSIANQYGFEPQELIYINAITSHIWKEGLLLIIPKSDLDISSAKAESEARKNGYSTSTFFMTSKEKKYSQFRDQRFPLGLGIIGGNSSSPYIHPIDGKGDISSPFGARELDDKGKERLHAGVDIGSPTGTPIKAIYQGVVTLAQWNGGYGNCVILDHGRGLISLYGHMHKIRVKEGQMIAQGDHIGDVGNTGKSYGSHLHLEMRLHDTPINPFSLLP